MQFAERTGAVLIKEITGGRTWCLPVSRRARALGPERRSTKGGRRGGLGARSGPVEGKGRLHKIASRGSSTSRLAAPRILLRAGRISATN
jgi:hypothetical protein